MSASVAYAHYQFTVADYHRMLETGVLNKDSRVELLNGEIIKMSPIGSRHAGKLKRLRKLLGQKLDPDIVIGVQDPIQLDDRSEPQPDLSILKPRQDFYESANPLADDVLFVIEVADSSVVFDREIKMPLYARAGVAEVWLVDLKKDRIEVHAKPHDGAFREVRIAQRGQQIISTTIPELMLNADEILG